VRASPFCNVVSCKSLYEYNLYCEQVLFAFMVGLHNLYWYYGSQTYKKDSTDKLVHTSEAFQGFDFIASFQITQVK